jgi:hypothetical protein
MEQGRAARTRDIESLELATRVLSERTAEAVHAERERFALAARLERHLGLGPGEFRLSLLVARAPEPWRSRVSALQVSLREVIASTRALVDANGRYMRDGARTANRIVASLMGAAAPVSSYDSDGRQPDSGALCAVLNVAG